MILKYSALLGGCENALNCFFKIFSGLHLPFFLGGTISCASYSQIFSRWNNQWVHWFNSVYCICGGDNGSVYLLFYTSSSSKMRPICTSLPFSARWAWSRRFFVRQLLANIWILLNPVSTGHSCSPLVHCDTKGCRDSWLNHGLHARRVWSKFEVSFTLNFQSLRS